MVTGYTIWGIELPGDNHHIHFSGLKVKGGEAGVHLTEGDSGRPPAHGPVSHVTLEDCVIQNTVYTPVDGTPGPCNQMMFRRIEVSEAGIGGEAFYGSDGIVIEKGSHITVEDFYIHDNGGDGLDLNSRDREGRVPGIVVQGNVLARNRLNGVKLWAGGLIEKNVLWGMGENPLLVGIFPCRAKSVTTPSPITCGPKSMAAATTAPPSAHPEESGPARPRKISRASFCK